MSKKLSLSVIMILCVLLLTGCCFHKEWAAATCEIPKTCVECGETEGDALGHNWVDATCEAPKTCSVCHKQEGAALGHSWEDATTEAPKTCVTCALTEGERIITDPRFTTAATKALHGKWVGEMNVPSDLLGIGDFGCPMIFRVTLNMDNKGGLTTEYAFVNEEEFNTALITHMTDFLYAQLATGGYDQAAADEESIKAFGMNVPDYAASIVNEIHLGDVVESLDLSCVYYVEGTVLYTGLSWDSVTDTDEFILDGDTLILNDTFTGLSEEPVSLTRVTE